MAAWKRCRGGDLCPVRSGPARVPPFYLARRDGGNSAPTIGPLETPSRLYLQRFIYPQILTETLICGVLLLWRYRGRFEIHTTIERRVKILRDDLSSIDYEEKVDRNEELQSGSALVCWRALGLALSRRTHQP